MSAYIFVDFDGPMLPGKMHLFDQNRKTVASFMSGGSPIPYFDPVAMQMLNLWAKHGNAEVVFSTSWARVYRGDYRTMIPYLKQIMTENGYTGGFAEEILTPKRLSSSHVHEINLWLDDNLKKDDVFIAIDDADLTYLNFKDQGKWLSVNYDDGLTWEHFKQGCTALKINNEQLLYLEYGIPIKTEEEKAESKRLLDLYGHAFI